MCKNARFTVTPKPLQQTQISPVEAKLRDDGILFVDFGKAAFGTLLIPSKNREKLVVHLGEQLNADGRVEREPAGTIRYLRVEQDIAENEAVTRIIIPPDPRNTGPAAIRMPAEIGEVFPFRYAEIEAADGIDAKSIRQIAVHYPFNDDAGVFRSSENVLNAVWELCKYSIKATSFCGVYVDGDRERIPYEGDAYINQLCHYGVDNEYALARYTHEYLLQHPTWPTEWQLHSVLMAWADYEYTGETASLAAFYPDLCAKTLIDLAREDGLISTESEKCTREFEERLNLHHEDYIFNQGLRDLVDWPPGSFTDGGIGERDNHEMRPINTVVNAFHCHTLALMSRIARVLGHAKDAARFEQQTKRVQESINHLLFDEKQGVYIDGAGSSHASLHSNMFMLAFDLVPPTRKKSVIEFVKSRGMACSVYGAHYLLEALYRNSEAQHALELMTAQHDRGWWNMIQVGSTITMEAWDLKYKNNLDWNHAWGAAPANIIPRFVLGVQPLEPAFRKILIQPQPGSLRHISGKVPTIQGPVTISLDNSPSGSGKLDVEIPANTLAKIGLPARGGKTAMVTVDGEKVAARLENGFCYVDQISGGCHTLIF